MLCTSYISISCFLDKDRKSGNLSFLEATLSQIAKVPSV